MVFKLGIFLLFSLFTSALEDYFIQDCDEDQTTRVRSALDDAVYLAGRATETLDEALNSPDGIPYPVEIILNAFLQPEDPETYGTVRDIFYSIANNLKEKDIRYYCKNPIYEIPGRGPFYPVSLDRIKGRKILNTEVDCQRYFDGPNFVFPCAATPDSVKSISITIISQPKTYQLQIDCTGSTEPWTDIILKDVLTLNNGGKTITFNQWPSFLKKTYWKDILGQSIDDINSIDQITTTSFIHELIHSVALQTPIDGHYINRAELERKGVPANFFIEVLEAGYLERTDYQFQPTPLYQNPATLAWLCLSLAMPWFKLFDDENNLWDGALRFNKYEDGGVWIPQWVAQGRPPIEALVEEAYMKGPYFPNFPK